LLNLLLYTLFGGIDFSISSINNDLAEAGGPINNV
jgi:hypothetical protein